MKTIQITEDAFLSEKEFPSDFAQRMGFPDFYGHNWDAWIDYG